MFRRRLGLLVALTMPCLLVVSSVAHAEFSFVPGSVDFTATNQDGTPVTQAGSHPYQVTTKFLFGQTTNSAGNKVPDGSLRDIHVAVPPGLVGDPIAVPQCTQAQFHDENEAGVPSCSLDSQIGVASVTTSSEQGLGEGLGFAVYNLVPPPGVPAEFGFTVGSLAVLLTTSVRTEDDYGVTVSSLNTTEGATIYGTTLTLWGVPADASHDNRRCVYPYPECNGRDGQDTTAPHSSSVPPVAFLRMPTSCSGQPSTTISADSWPRLEDESVTPGLSIDQEIPLHDESGDPIGLDGCDRLTFNPSVTISPDTAQADTPAGLTAEVKVPQPGLLAPGDIATADIKNTTVTLPAGVVINPGQAAGLVACQLSEDGVGTSGPPSCPQASRVGTVQITTPLLPDKLEGTLYILPSNPPNLQILLAASADGVNLKLVGDVHLDPVTGQLTTTFANTPQLPFSDLKLSFSGGAQAALETPLRCGLYVASADFTPWSTPFTPDALSTSSFSITNGPGGGPCPSSLPFSPSMIAGSTTDQAGGFTSFSLLLQRGDGQQRVSRLQFKTPEGLLGMIGKVALCGEPQAAQGDCGPGSQIGHTVVEAGPGPYPLVVPQPGAPPAPIYLTGSYDGAPYGLSIAVPVVAGPFNLGTIVVRARVEVDPHTTQLTVTTDPLPSIVDGIPTDLRAINAVIDRPGFMFNPTGCSAQSFSGTATSTEGASAGLSSHFQMGSCRSLLFKPNFQVSTSGKTSRANGASLDAKILYPTGPLGDNQASQQSNIQSVKVDLPKQLPSRLSTLQKACPAAKFEANPADCPAGSIVGHATAITPVLPVSLTGPAYFVSHAGEEFPSLIVVLQGYGVTVDVVGSTFIDPHTNITSSTFKQIPDVPITSFDLKLPQGPNSALAANKDLCISTLKMPTAFTAQDGAVIHQTTKIKVTGCAKKKSKTKKAATHKTNKAALHGKKR